MLMVPTGTSIVAAAAKGSPPLSALVLITIGATVAAGAPVGTVTVTVQEALVVAKLIGEIPKFWILTVTGSALPKHVFAVGATNATAPKSSAAGVNSSAPM